MIHAELPNLKTRERTALSDPRPQAKGSRTGEGVNASVDAPAERRRPPENASEMGLLEWAYDEYHRLIEEGEQPDIVEFCARFPAYRSVMLRLFDVKNGLGDNPELLSGTSADNSLPWPEEGESRGDWTIVRELGRGRFARVYLATEASTGDRPVVLKFSVRGGAEARTLGRLSHPHVVPILSARLEESTDLTIVCMPYLGGATLEDVLDRVWTPGAPQPRGAAALLDVFHTRAQPEDPLAGPVDPRLQRGAFADGVIHLAIQLAEALAFLHAGGVYHRDLKPSNILLDPSGKPLLLDFNLSASALEAAPVGGTLSYMAPEHLRLFLGETVQLDGRADLFALAAIVCELLTGERPHGPLPNLKAASQARFLLQRFADGFPPFQRLGPDLERPVAAVLERCLSADPANRPSNAVELATELKRQFAPARRARRWIAARPRLALTALGLFAFVAALAGYTWAISPPYSERAYEAGKVAYQAGRYDEAEQHFERALQNETDNARWRRARGWARLKASDSLPEDEARDKMDQAWNDLIHGQGGDLDAKMLEVKAYLLARQQDSRKALGIYNQLAESGHQPVALLNNRAFCSIQLSDGAARQQLLAQAEEDLENAAALSPNCQAILYNRATLALCREGFSRRSLDDIERAVQLGPTTASLYRDAALLYAQAADLRHVPVLLDAPIAAALFLEARPYRIERALYYAREAIAAGQSPRQFVVLKNLVPPPVLVELQRMQPGPRTTGAELRLIAPADGVD